MHFFSQDELSRLPISRAQAYCDEIRAFLVKNVCQNGGHLASNLGICEISTALCRVLDLPRDRVIYDTGHQSYVHKILTGRGEAFSTLRQKGGLAGFPRREESEYDPFGTGHSGTGLSAALSFAKADRLAGRENVTAVVIGDGAFSGGMVFEALNHISPHDRVIILLNDNKMSIGASTGRFRNALNHLRTEEYYRIKSGVGDALEKIPVAGTALKNAARRIKHSIKRQALPAGNFFEDMGLHYFGPANGNDLEQVEVLLREAKKRKGPSVIHFCTKKGKGYEPAEADPSRFHGVSPKGEKKREGKSFSAIFGENMVELAKKEPSLVAISAAMCDGVGLCEFAKAFPDRFFDTGIAEEHAMTFAAGLSAAGLKPVFAVYSTFYQRAIDQLLHDAALQKLPITVCLDRAGLSGEDGATHHGMFDVALSMPIPNLKIYAPATAGELSAALKKAISESDGPSLIRYPKGTASALIEEKFPCRDAVEKKDFENSENCGMIMVSYGRITEEVYRAAERLSASGERITLVRFSCLKGYPKEVLPAFFGGAKKVLFVEEGIKAGSFSEHLLSELIQSGLLSGASVRILASEEKFVSHGAVSCLLEEEGLTAEGIEKEWKQFGTA